MKGSLKGIPLQGSLRVPFRGPRSQVLLWGILPQIIIVIPNIETLHSTIQLLWTLGALVFRQGFHEGFKTVGLVGFPAFVQRHFVCIRGV